MYTSLSNKHAISFSIPKMMKSEHLKTSKKKTPPFLEPKTFLSDRGLTSLHHAARKGHSLLAKELLRYGADLKAQDNWGPVPRVWRWFGAEDGEVTHYELRQSDFL